jgi:hypothetical protein
MIQEKCVNILLENNVDGAIIYSIPDTEISAFLTEIGIVSSVQRARLSAELVKINAGLSSPKKATLATVEVHEVEVENNNNNNKFEASLSHMVFGSDEDYKDGLTKKITSLDHSMEEECSTNDGGKWKKEFDYVVNGIATESRENKNRIRDEGHEGMRLEAFVSHPIAVEANLSSAEVVPLRLYTGTV